MIFSKQNADTQTLLLRGIDVANTKIRVCRLIWSEANKHSLT